MTQWQAIENPALDANQVFDILKMHKLLPESRTLAATMCKAMGACGRHYDLKDEFGDVVAHVFVSGVIAGESAAMDLIPFSKYFWRDFDEAFSESVKMILDDLFLVQKVRRVEAMFPASRSRTKRALCSIGFRVEGRKEEGVRLLGREPEDLRILALLEKNYVR